MESQTKMQKMQRQSESVAQIYEDGLIKKNDVGVYKFVDDASERHELKAQRSKTKHRQNIVPRYNDDLLDSNLNEEADME